MAILYILKDNVGYFSANGEREKDQVLQRKPGTTVEFFVTADREEDLLTIAKEEAREREIKVPDLYL
ncbi:MAG: hypothetical protein Q8L36_03595 [bacterium]|nr:hypothetical protein [bacterium]